MNVARPIARLFDQREQTELHMPLLLNLSYTWCRGWQRVASQVSAFQAWERLLRAGEPRALAPLVRTYARWRCSKPTWPATATTAASPGRSSASAGARGSRDRGV